MINRFESKSHGQRRKHTFAFIAPDATSVQLVGDFTRWTEYPISLLKNRNGVWETRVDLPKGTHHYRFLVDGEWRDDPESDLRVPNPFGTQNSVAQID
jgi:1,4-alpha-glucan branching enzyme